MSDLLLQTIVEKLEAFEIALLKRNDDETKNAAQHFIANEIKPYQSEIKQCATDLKNLNTKLELLIRKQNDISKSADARRDYTVHQHHLHKGLWISLALSLL